MEPAPPSQASPLSSKRFVDPLNSVAWFAMDAFWFSDLVWPAYVAAMLTVVTGGLLLILGRRDGRASLFADMGLICWIVMNTVWMIYDLNDQDTPRTFAAGIALLGAGFIIAAAWFSQDLRRLRIVGR